MPYPKIYNRKSKEEQRKELRSFGTAAEAVLWKCLQRRQVLGKKFRRQESIGPYIVDFYCPDCRLIVELDGARHFRATVEEYEERRTKYLEERGLKIVRFENCEVYRDLEFVLERIREEIGRER